MSDDAILELTLEGEYIGSAVSPTVDITETSDDVTVTITDYLGDHSYTIEKTDQAIADAEAAATAANSAASYATSTADAAAASAVDIAQTAAASATATAGAAADNANAKATLADTAASNANTKAALADSKATLANTAAQNADAKAALANTAATTANASAANADAKATAAQEAATAATSAASTAVTAASNADAKAALANTAASNADTKAALADTAATNANTKAGLADAAATAANTAAAAANAAREAIQDDLAAKADLDAYAPLLTAGIADSLLSADEQTATFTQRVSDHDGSVGVRAILGNTIVEDDELVSVNVDGVKAVGFNQWDEVWENGTINGSGQPASANSIRSKNFIPVFPSTAYYIAGLTSGLLKPFFYDSSKNFISAGYWGGGTNNNPFTTPANCHYMKFALAADYGTTYKGGICINISNPTLNGTFLPYTKQTREIPVSDYFPDGMRSAGTAFDELQRDKAITRIGAVDLGTLTWNGYTQSGEQMFLANMSEIKLPATSATVANAKCAALTVTSANRLLTTDDNILAIGEYFTTIRNINAKMNSVSTAEAFKAAISGVMLYYELATPTTTEIDPPINMDYPTEQGGMESIVIPTGEMSAAPTFVYVQGYDADGVADRALSVIAPLEGAKASTNYAIGSYFVHAGKLYKATSAIATGEAITPGTNCTATTVMAELAALTA